MDSNHFKWFKMRWLDSIAVLFPPGSKSNFTSFDLHKGFLEGLMWFIHMIFQKKNDNFFFLPISILSEKYTCAKVKLEMMLQDSLVAQVAPILTWRGWSPVHPKDASLEEVQRQEEADSCAKTKTRTPRTVSQEPQPMQKTPRADFGWLHWNTSS